MSATATCPSCGTDRTADTGGAGYVCRQCGTTWRLVTCRSCGSTWQAGPDVQFWTCGKCGEKNFGDGLTPRGARRDSAGGPRGRPHRTTGGISFADRASGSRRGGVIVAILIVAGLIAGAFLLFGGGGDGKGPDHGGGNQAALAAARVAFCGDLRELSAGTYRAELLGRVIPKIEHDAQLYRKAGDADTADAIGGYAKALNRLRRAILGSGKTRAANMAVGRAVAKVPHCGP